MIKKLIFFKLVLLLFVTTGLAEQIKSSVPENAETITKGKKLYLDRCWYCHGKEGDGNGPVADFLDPRPRDFTVGQFKIRTTKTGTIPTNSDLYKIISKGIPGTAMPRWEKTLTEEERWQLVYFIKTYSDEFEDPEYEIVQIPQKVESSPESIQRGKEVFNENKCFECHGVDGRGDGQKGGLEDGWGFPLRVRNLNMGWNIKGGSSPEDIVYRFSTGIDGTPMPSWPKIKDVDKWHLANYIVDKASAKFSDEVVIVAKKIESEIPEATDSPLWNSASVLRIPLAGQVVVQPRWQNHAISMVEVKAIYNEKQIGLLIEWDDPFKDTEHHADREVKKFDTTYVKAFDEIPREVGNFRDSLAVQFPVKLRKGAKKPHFVRGDSGNPVNLWIFKSDLAEAGKNPIVDTNANGFKKPLKDQPQADQQVSGVATYKLGRWSVTMVRDLKTDSRKDVQFETARMIPIAFNAWDGSNGEHGLIMSLSAWSYIYLETDIPADVYIYAGVVVAGAFLLIVIFVGYSRKEQAK